MRIIFFGSSEYCLSILDSLLKNFQLIAVVTKQASAAQRFAKLHNISVYTPKDKTQLSDLRDKLKQLHPDLAVVADYGLIIPEEIFEIPRYKTLNIHFSHLPDLRGPSPVQFTILTGAKSAWITVIIMAEEMDTGDIIWQKEVPLTSGKSTNYPIIQLSNYPINETAESLYKKLFNIISLELFDIVNKYIKGEIKPQKQDHSKATYTKILTREDGYIASHTIEAAMKGKLRSEIQLDKRGSSSLLHCYIVTLLHPEPIASVIERAIRAFTPWPGVWTELHLHLQGHPLQMASERAVKKRIKILKAHLENTEKIQDRKAKLVLDQVQLEGKNPVSWKQFKEGYPHFLF